jgi:hypothetical protein
MNVSTIWRTGVALLAAAAAAAVAGAAAPAGDAQGVTPDQLVAHGWTCVTPPLFPDRIACFDPGRGRPFPGNPDPRPSYSVVVFERSSGELWFTVHFIRADLYHGQPCGDHPYVFRAPIGYWECEHR